MSRPRCLVLASLLSLGLLLVAGPASAGAALQIYPAKLHVAGGLTITTTHDALKSCQPGQSWTLEEKVDVELSKSVKIERNGSRLTSTDARQPGGAVNSNSLAAYSESNYCAPEDPTELRKPECATFRGTLAASLQPDPRRTKPARVSIGMTRLTGGTQSLSCLGSPIGNPTPTGTKIDALQTTYGAIVLPLDLKVDSFRTLGKGRKLIRTINVGGSCESPIVYRGSHISTASIDDTCSVDGVFNVEIKRLK